VLQPVKSYPALGQPFGNNDWPFLSVKVLSTTSPLLDGPYDPNTAPHDNPPLGAGKVPDGETFAQVFLPTSAGSPIMWDLVAVDLAGTELHLRLPLYFFEAADSGNYASEFDAGGVEQYVNAYNALVGNRQCITHSARLKLAPEAGGPSGGTAHPVVNVTFGAASPTNDPNVPTNGYRYPGPPSSSSLGSAVQPAFYPVLCEVQAHLSAADALTRGSFSDSSGDGVKLQYYPAYVAEGLSASAAPASNPGAVYAQLSEAVSSAKAPLLQFPADLVGGLGCPNGHMLGLSAIAGPVAGDSSSPAAVKSALDHYAGNGKPASPANYFQQLNDDAQTALAQLLGSLHLGDIIGAFTSDLPGGAPNITSSLDQDTGTLTVVYTLKAELSAWPSGSSPPPLNTVGTVFEPSPGGGGQIQMTATATVTKDGAATYDVQGSIDPFNLYLFGKDSSTYVVFVPFGPMTFSAQNGQKPSVQVSIGSSGSGVSFEGPLSFVNALEQFLADLGGPGMSVSVTGSQLDASFSLGLPTVGLGVFSLSGISLSAGISVPFLGGPAVAQFGFASQENPFTLTVCMFGGGGFFLIGVGFGGIQQIQAQFEFEGQFELDILVASGGLSLAAGVYYSYAAPPSPGTGGTTTLTGFVRMTGELSMLGLISISAELDLSLTYQETGGQSSVAGTASLTVTITICFFSVSPSITVHKQFSGGGGTSEAAEALVTDGPHHSDRAVTGHGPAAKPILFADIVPDESTWGTCIAAFGP
jgi:hypothetical protein